MISLFNYRILRGPEASRQLEAEGAVNIFREFDLAPPPKKPAEQEVQEAPEEPEIPPEEAIMQEAIWKAESILQQARAEAEEMKKEAYDAGFSEGVEAGKETGRRQAYEEEQEIIQGELRSLEEKIGQYVADMQHEKEKLLEQYLDDLKNISLAIGEKIVQTSLKSSSEVVKRMILAATEKLKKTAWAKIYVAKTTEEMDIQGDVQLLRELAKLSDNVKIIVMEDAEPGTCIVELPQEIIDISAGTQMENIRDILNNARI